MSIFLSLLIVNNLVLFKFFGVELLFGKREEKRIIKYEIISLLSIISISSFIYYALKMGILLGLPETLEVFGAGIAALLGMVTYSNVVYFYNPKLHREKIREYLKSLTINSLVLGILILNHNDTISMLEYLFRNILSIFGFAIVLCFIPALIDRVDIKRLPKYISIEVIILIFLGFLSMAVSGLSGILN